MKDDQFYLFIFRVLKTMKKLMTIVIILELILQTLPIIEGIILKDFFNFLSMGVLNYNGWLIALRLIILYVAIFLIRKLYYHCRAMFNFNFEQSIRETIVINYINNYSALTNQSSGRLINSMKDDVNQIQVFIGWAFTVIGQLLRILIAIIILLRINVFVTCISILPVLTIIIGVQCLDRNVVEKRSKLRTSIGDVNSFLGQIISSISALKALPKFTGIMNQYENLCEERKKMDISDTVLTNIIESIYNNAHNIAVIMTMLAYCGLFGDMKFSLGDFTLFVTYSVYITDAIESLGNLLVYKQQTVVCFHNLISLFKYDNKKIVYKKPEKYFFASFEIKRDNKDSCIKINKGDKVIIKNDGFDDLIYQMLGISKGDIEFTYTDLNNQTVAIDSLVSLHISYVPQHPTFFLGSMKENLSFTDNYKDDAIEWALENAQLLVDVNKWKDGINHDIGYNGSKLSGGQKQRLGFARALIKQPELLIVDNATTGLDNDTVTNLINCLSKMKDMTILFISDDERVNILKEEK